MERARQWCRDNNIPFTPQPGDYPTDVHEAQTKISFTEEMKGYYTRGEMDYDKGFKDGRDNDTGYNVSPDDHGGRGQSFCDRPGPRYRPIVVGYIQCDELGGQLPVEKGVFNLFVDDADPSVKRMFYRLFFTDGNGQPMTLSGHKLIKDDPGFDLWHDTTTLYTRILRGHVSAEEEKALEQDGQLEQAVVGSGIIVIPFFSFLKQLTTFRAEGPTLSDRTSAMARFGRLFMGKLWDVYARHVLTSGPF